MLELLERLVNLDSGSRDPTGVARVIGALEVFLGERGIATTRDGDVLVASIGDGVRPVVLIGHADTVFPAGEAARRPFRRDDTRAYGPGVADMKAGLVMMCAVLVALRGKGPRVVALFTPDEEIGSPASRPVIERHVAGARAAFVAEPGRPSGAVVTSRKGGVFLRFDIAGKAAHAGGNFEGGASAIAELAHKTLAFGALVDRARGITLNVGVVRGGHAVNVVAPWARGELDVRFRGDRDQVMAAVEAILGQTFVPGTRTTWSITGEFVPFVASTALYEHYAACAREIGFAAPAEPAGGCSDAGFCAALGVPTLCAIGPVGGRGHTPHEYLELATLEPRADALALAIERLPA